MDELSVFLMSNADGDSFQPSWQAEAMERFDMSCAKVEEAILAVGLLPARYQRNRQMLSSGQQLQLFRSKVAVVGCGGVGGYVIEELARLGVGQIMAGSRSVRCGWCA